MLRAVFALALVAVAAPNSIGEGVCGDAGCSPAQNQCQLGVTSATIVPWNGAEKHGVTTLALCVALAKARPANNKRPTPASQSMQRAL